MVIRLFAVKMLRPEASAIAGIWISAEAGEMCGSKPEPEAVSKSVGISSRFTPGLAARNSSISACTRSARAGLDGP